MDISILTCTNKCCNLKVKTYIPDSNKIYCHNRQQKKAGALIFDNTKNKILLVQSKGNFWGIPKGTVKENEHIYDSAIREVKEETGITISPSDFINTYHVNNKGTYFHIQMNECEVDVQTEMIDNDANGIGWINLTCLNDLIERKIITLNKHTIILLQKFLK